MATPLVEAEGEPGFSRDFERRKSSSSFVAFAALRWPAHHIRLGSIEGAALAAGEL